MSIDHLRDEIDTIDARILKLLKRRSQIARQIGAEKSACHEPVYDPAREAELLRQITDVGAEPMSKESVRTIYREIIAACRGLQELTVAYLGPQHTNTYFAAVRHFGHSADLTPCRTIEQIFDMTARGRTRYGIVPIENSLQGVVGETCDLLLNTALTICAETFLPIHHALLAACPMDEITAVYSHPQVFAQSRHWLQEHLPQADQVAASSTAAAAQTAADRPGAAALAAADAAEPAGLDVLAENIEDRPDNRTRFFVIGNTKASPTARDKTSVVFSVPHRAGSLHAALQAFAQNEINMTLIQSRPTKDQPWKYVFFVDIEGHVADDRVAAALEALRQKGAAVRLLGSYPAADIEQDS